MKRIQRKSCQIKKYKMNKIYLSYFDDKRYIPDNGIQTLAYIYEDAKKAKVLYNQY